MMTFRKAQFFYVLSNTLQFIARWKWCWKVHLNHFNILKTLVLVSYWTDFWVQSLKYDTTKCFTDMIKSHNSLTALWNLNFRLHKTESKWKLKYGRDGRRGEETAARILCVLNTFQECKMCGTESSRNEHLLLISLFVYMCWTPAAFFKSTKARQFL